MKPWLLLLLACLLLAPPAEARVARGVHEQARIDYLIDTVAGLQGAAFIRNGNEYDASRAADHLRNKLASVGDKVQTAEDFIERCATASWLSKRAYSIRLSDGRVLASAVFLRARLKEFDARKPAVAKRGKPLVDS